MTANAISAGTIETMGASVKTPLSARLGVMSSLSSSLTASAIGWRTPCGPTRMGPSRTCTQAMIFRSSSVMKVTDTSTAFSKTTIFSRGRTYVSTMFHRAGRRRSSIDLAHDDVD
jgi:hypothetical protein